MRKVTTSTVPQPSGEQGPEQRPGRAAFSTDQISMPIGRHCQNSRISARLEASTYVERSMDQGMICVQRSLNQGRAITLCWTAKTASSAQLIAIAEPIGPGQRPVEPIRHDGAAADERERVEERPQEQHVGREAVREMQESLEHVLALLD